MSLLCSGLSHHTAPVALRERLSFSAGDARALLGAPWFRAAMSAAGIAEVALLSTCNRTELYGSATGAEERDAAGAAALAAILARAVDIPEGVLAPHLYNRSGAAAVRHLCRVAAGLDSMVVGEAEVLGQVGAALGHAAESGTAGPVLDAAFHTALRAGRRARAETSISQRPASVAAEAARLLRDRLPTLERPEVLVLGTGAMGRSVARVLRGTGPVTLRVAGRTMRRAQEIASELGMEPVPWESLGDALSEVDAVVTATAATQPIVTERMVTQARGVRTADRPRLFVDIGVPRNVESSVRAIAGVEVYDLDHLQARIDGNIEERRAEVPRVEAIVEEEVAHFEGWRRGTQLRPVLAALRDKSEAIRRLEVERHLGQFRDAQPGLREAFDAFSRDLVTKLLHEPSRRLRAESDPTRSRASAEVLRELFDLPAPSSGQPGHTGDHA